MGLPDFDSNGNLPIGEHTVSWPVFKARYGTNPKRNAILAQIELWLVHMKQAGCRTVFIDGSFICKKADPGDFDACWDNTGVDAKTLSPLLLDQTPAGRKAIKDTFGGDIKPDMACPPGSIRPYLKFFQTDRDGNRKGIVRIDLMEFDP